MAKVKFYDNIQDKKLSFAVIISKMGGNWVLCKHKDRNTLEFPGGHREIGESILETAKRELQEETGAEEFTIKQVGFYSVKGTTRDVKEPENEIFGVLFTAEIISLKQELNCEIERIFLLDELPTNWTYPDVMPQLIKKL